ncbi:hypothetical protein HZH66_003150 [Vespula vulgaris]|uniref:Uncharacterized protein n=1 Tax=Vespula vulgaris TaxID=7454 RepID=A0A834KKX4_VESVU|nr:hypothetical protein HZH66_003150 [Vespula vulgaris]
MHDKTALPPPPPPPPPPLRLLPPSPSSPLPPLQLPLPSLLSTLLWVGRTAEIRGAWAAMQRAVAGGGPGPLGLQGPPRSVKISPVNIQDEPGDPTSQIQWTSDVKGLVSEFRVLWLSIGTTKTPKA